MHTFRGVNTSRVKKLEAEEGANPFRKPPNGLLLIIAAIFGGVFLTTNVAIHNGYIITTSAEATQKGVGWKFEGKPPLPPSKQP